jgi:hypothetical protein
VTSANGIVTLPAGNREDTSSRSLGEQEVSEKGGIHIRVEYFRQVRCRRVALMDSDPHAGEGQSASIVGVREIANLTDGFR